MLRKLFGKKDTEKTIKDPNFEISAAIKNVISIINNPQYFSRKWVDKGDEDILIISDCNKNIIPPVRRYEFLKNGKELQVCISIFDNLSIYIRVIAIKLNNEIVMKNSYFRPMAYSVFNYISNLEYENIEIYKALSSLDDKLNTEKNIINKLNRDNYLLKELETF